MTYIDTYIQIPNTSSFTGPLVRALQYTIDTNVVDVHTFVLQDPNNATQFANVTASNRLVVDGSQVTQPVSGTVSISGTVPVSGSISVSNFPGTQPVSGTVAVSNFPATQPVSIASVVNVSTKTNLTYSSPTSASVGTSSAPIVAANSSRQGLIVTNLTGNTIFFAFGNAAVLNSGGVIPPYGGFSMDEYTFTTAAMNGIAGTSGNTVAVQEIT
jgi:hypothetical protein